MKGFVSNDNALLDVLRAWHTAAPNLVVATPGFEGTTRNPLPDIEKLTAEYEAGWLGAMGEIGAEYGGLSPDDPKLEPYFALAERLDLAVGIHTGVGPPGMPTTNVALISESRWGIRDCWKPS